MTNSYYNRTFDVIPGNRVGSQRLEDEMSLVAIGFDKLPTPAALQGGQATYSADAGAANAYVATLGALVIAYGAGLAVRLKVANVNTGASTLNVNGLGAVAIKRGDGSALLAGDLKAGQIAELAHDGTAFQLLASGAAADAAAAATSAGTAATQAGIAFAQAGISTTQAGYSQTSATQASVYAAALAGASTTSLAIGLGNKSFTASTGKQWAAGQYLLAASAANNANYMDGQVVSYNSASGALVLNCTSTGGTGTFADWSISISGVPGVSGSRTTPEVLENKTLLSPKESIVPNATALTGAINLDIGLGTVHNRTTNSSANWTINFRWSSGTTMNAQLAVDESLTVTLRAKQGATAYRPTAFSIDGNAVTPQWMGGAAPPGGNVNSSDVYTFVIIKTASATFSVLATQTRFA